MNRRLEVFILSAVFLLSDEEGAGHPCPDWVSSLLLLRWSGLFLSRNLSGILPVCCFLATWQQKLLITKTFCIHSCLCQSLAGSSITIQDFLQPCNRWPCKTLTVLQRNASKQLWRQKVLEIRSFCCHVARKQQTARIPDKLRERKTWPAEQQERG